MRIGRRVALEQISAQSGQRGSAGRMRIGRRVARVLIWGVVLCLSSLAGGIWFLYWHITDSETISKLIREQGVRYFPKAILDPGRVRPRIFAGELVFHDFRLRQAIDGNLFETLRIPFLQLRVNARKLTEGVFEPREIIVGQPTLRLRARRDGTWNLQGLIADPWPGPWIETPPINIRNGTLELYPCEEPAPSSDRPPDDARGKLSSASQASPAARAGPENPPQVSLPRTSAVPSPNGHGAVDQSPAILRDVSLTIKPVPNAIGCLEFEGTARGDGFERLALRGSIDFRTGMVEFGGQLSGLLLSESFRRRLPPAVRRNVAGLALNGGVIDLEVNRFRYDPASPPASRMRYNMTVRLRDGVWECPDLPFPVNDVSALVSVEDRVLSIKSAHGTNGMTTLSAAGVITLDGLKHESLDLRVNLHDLELDDRLRKWTPEEYKDLWDLFKPRGRVDIALNVARAKTGAPLDWDATVNCHEVAAEYRHFRYPLDHLNGVLTFEKDTLNVDLRSLSGRPSKISGKITHPGPDAVVELDVIASSLPIDDVLKKAMPADVRKVVNQFNPSGLVNARASISRTPNHGPGAPPEGRVKIDAVVDLAERCEITWEGLPFPVRNLKGRLEIHPDKWTFKNVYGSNGHAKITASGSVVRLPGLPKAANGDEPLKIDIALEARKLPFSGELQSALPRPWRKIWPTINPSGACDVDAEVHVAPGARERVQIKVTPLPESNLRLLITRSPQPGIDPGGTFELPMDDVHGQFVFYNGEVTMNDVHLDFRGAPVRFSSGTVLLEDSGRFNLNVLGLWVEGLRFDSDLRKKMPPLMAQFARRLDGGGSFQARGDLQIGWTGDEHDPAWCRWKNTKVILNDNAVRTEIPLEHIQGQLENVGGWSNGMKVEVEGIMHLESVSFMGQQVTQLESPFHVKDGHATLDSIQGHYLGGVLLGDEPCWISLDVTPRYHAALSLHDAQLAEYARTIAGRQSYRGNVDAKILLDGLGSDVHSIQGRGEAHISQGDVGELPPVLRIASLLRLASAINSMPSMSVGSDDRKRTPAKTAFDSADVNFTVANGTTKFDPIKFTGNAFSLLGTGTLGPQGDLDLRLSPLWGRDRFHIPIVSDFARRASTPFVIAHVKGTMSNLQYDVDLLPPVSDALKALNRNRGEAPQQ